MKRWTLLLHGIPLVVYLALGFVVYTKVTQWAAVSRADKQRLIAETVQTFKALNAENATLQAALARHQQVVVRYVQRADQAKHTTDSLLTRHPVHLAPAACQPYVLAVSSCQREASNLRRALDTANAALKAAQANLARNRAALVTGRKALDASRCHFPCLDLGVWGGALLGTDMKLHTGIGLGIKIH